MKLGLLLMLMGLAGCSCRVTAEDSPQQDVRKLCRRAFYGMSDTVYRCENEEVICYQSDGVEATALQCKFKRNTP